jgi:hypothetical protein
MLNEQQAREMTAHWISPNDPELCRFASHHPSTVDWAEFVAEMEKCYDYADAHSDPIERSEARAEVTALLSFARMMKDKRDYPRDWEGSE